MGRSNVARDRRAWGYSLRRSTAATIRKPRGCLHEPPNHQIFAYRPSKVHSRMTNTPKQVIMNLRGPWGQCNNFPVFRYYNTHPCCSDVPVSGLGYRSAHCTGNGNFVTVYGFLMSRGCEQPWVRCGLFGYRYFFRAVRVSVSASGIGVYICVLSG